MFGLRSSKIKVDINPETGKMAEIYPNLLKNKMTGEEWKKFCNSIEQAYREEKELTRSKRNCCLLWSAVLTLPLILPPFFICQKYCKGKQNRSFSRLRELCDPICARTTEKTNGLSFKFTVKYEKEEAQKFNETSKEYDKFMKKVPKHYIVVKTA